MSQSGPVLSDERLDRYQPLGAFGQPVWQNHVQLTAALRQRLGQRYADFFAVPRLDEGNGRISWVSPVAGEARRWSDLPEDEQARRALDLQVMKAEFQTYLDELKAYEADPDSPRGARAFVAVMEQALRSPDDGHLYFVGEQPVSTFWGFREEEALPVDTLSPGRRAAPVAAATVQNWRWLWWLLPLLLLLLLLLLWWFWPDDPGVDGFDDKPIAEENLSDIPKEEEEKPKEEEKPEEEEPLDPARRGVIVEGDGGSTVVDGDRVEGEGTIEVPGDAVPEGEGEGAVTGPALPEGEGAPEGEVPEVPQPEVPEAPQPEGAEAPQPEAPEPPQPEGAEPPALEPPALEPGAPPPIPENAADGAATFMQGRWTGGSGLIDSRSGRKLTQEYQFDDQGQGETIVRRDDGVTCRAPATATVKGGKLEVEEQQNLKCSDGSTIARSRTVCTTGASGKAECIGTDTDGDRFRVDLNRGGQ